MQFVISRSQSDGLTGIHMVLKLILLSAIIRLACLGALRWPLRNLFSRPF